jgi:hypothetical protein
MKYLGTHTTEKRVLKLTKADECITHPELRTSSVPRLALAGRNADGFP